MFNGVEVIMIALKLKVCAVHVRVVCVYVWCECGVCVYVCCLWCVFVCDVVYVWYVCVGMCVCVCMGCMWRAYMC